MPVLCRRDAMADGPAAAPCRSGRFRLYSQFAVGVGTDSPLMLLSITPSSAARCCASADSAYVEERKLILQVFHRLLRYGDLAVE